MLKFVEHFFWIAAAVDPVGDHPDEMWDDEDGFFYDVLRLPDGTGQRLKVRSLVGLLPALRHHGHRAPASSSATPSLAARIQTYLDRNHDLLANIADPLVPGVHGRHILSLVNEDKLKRILARMLDEERFLGPHGIRSVSRAHLDEPYVLEVEGVQHRVTVRAGRVHQRDVRRQLELARARVVPHQRADRPGPDPALPLLRRRPQGRVPDGLGHDDDPVRGGPGAHAAPRRHLHPGPDGRRPVYGGTEVFQDDPHWNDLILFYEYFHGDNGAGLGASHQTGWTGVVARLIQLLGHIDAESTLDTVEGPLARPYRRLTAEGLADVEVAREARGVHPGGDEL